LWTRPSTSSPQRYRPEAELALRGSGAPAARLRVHGALELGLVHLRAALDAEAFGILVELVPGAPAASLSGAHPAAPARGDVTDRRPRSLAGLARARPFLVHRSRRDLLGLGLAPA